MSVATAQEITEFWLDEVGPGGWYRVSDAVDEKIRTRFEPTWRAAAAGRLDQWISRPESALALLITLDQFPRNMHRGCYRAFSSDAKALSLAKTAIGLDHDRRIPEPERQFFYLPLMHSESLVDQARCVRLVLTRMPKTGAQTLKHARAHRDVIRRFSRFPYRNAALGRESSDLEKTYLAEGGYAV